MPGLVQVGRPVAAGAHLIILGSPPDTTRGAHMPAWTVGGGWAGARDPRRRQNATGCYLPTAQVEADDQLRGNAKTNWSLPPRRWSTARSGPIATEWRLLRMPSCLSGRGPRSRCTDLTVLELALQQYECIGSHVGVKQGTVPVVSFAAVGDTSRSHIEVSDLLAPGKSCANRTCVQNTALQRRRFHPTESP